MCSFARDSILILYTLLVLRGIYSIVEGRDLGLDRLSPLWTHTLPGLLVGPVQTLPGDLLHLDSLVDGVHALFLGEDAVLQTTPVQHTLLLQATPVQDILLLLPLVLLEGLDVELVIDLLAHPATVQSQSEFIGIVHHLHLGLFDVASQVAQLVQHLAQQRSYLNPGRLLQLSTDVLVLLAETLQPVLVVISESYHLLPVQQHLLRGLHVLGRP